MVMEEVDGAMDAKKDIAVFCVGNSLMLDDGIGPAVYEELTEHYEFPPNVRIFDVGCMGLDMLYFVDECDYMITVDAVDGTGEPAGCIFEFAPDEMARHRGATASLHELTLADLFDAAALMDMACEGKCFGMQVMNMSPEIITIGLTPPVYEALPLLVDTVLADLYRQGVSIKHVGTGKSVEPGWRHGDLCS